MVVVLHSGKIYPLQFLFALASTSPFHYCTTSVMPLLFLHDVFYLGFASLTTVNRRLFDLFLIPSFFPFRIFYTSAQHLTRGFYPRRLSPIRSRFSSLLLPPLYLSHVVKLSSSSFRQKKCSVQRKGALTPSQSELPGKCLVYINNPVTSLTFSILHQ